MNINREKTSQGCSWSGTPRFPTPAPAYSSPASGPGRGCGRCASTRPPASSSSICRSASIWPARTICFFRGSLSCAGGISTSAGATQGLRRCLRRGLSCALTCRGKEMQVGLLKGLARDIVYPIGLWR